MKGTLTPDQLAEVSLLLGSLDNFVLEMEDILINLDEPADEKILRETLQKLDKIYDSLCAFFHIKDDDKREEVYDENICND